MIAKPTPSGKGPQPHGSSIGSFLPMRCRAESATVNLDRRALSMSAHQDADPLIWRRVHRMTSIVPPTMGDPALYRIRVRGRLPSSYSARLEGMKVSPHVTTRGRVETVLVGRLRDQAALFGVLNMLYEFRMPIVSTRCLGRVEDRPGGELESRTDRGDRPQ
jgi:hypothetical protein